MCEKEILFTYSCYIEKPHQEGDGTMYRVHNSKVFGTFSFLPHMNFKIITLDTKEEIDNCFSLVYKNNYYYFTK